MVDTKKLYKRLKDKFQPDAAKELADILSEFYEDLIILSGKEFFEESQKIFLEIQETQHTIQQALLQIIQLEKQRSEKQAEIEARLATLHEETDRRFAELAEAQKRTEQRLDSLTQKVEELAEAQKRTEARVEELAEAQKKTEQRLDSLAERVEELAEAQKRTEARVEELAEAQKKTEQRLDSLAERVEELAEAQAKTERTVQNLIVRVDDISKQLGGLSNTVGYSLEDKSYKPLRRILEQEYGVKLSRLHRRNLVYSPDRYDEINIFGEAQKNGKKLYVIGECKAQFGVRDVDKFLGLIERAREYLKGDILPLTLAYQYHPQAEEKLKQLGIRVFWSYELIEE